MVIRFFMLTAGLTLAACGGGGGDDDVAFDAAITRADATTAVPDASATVPDAAVPDAAPPDATATDAALAAGCADGTREGFVSRAMFPAIAGCAGTWTGEIAEAAVLCETGWHVCRGDEPVFATTTYAQATAFTGCFGFDAAQDNYICRPDCSAAVDMGIDSAANIDMAGAGAGCAYQFPGTGGCLSDGRIDASENDGNGCSYFAGLTGTVCCAD